MEARTFWNQIQSKFLDTYKNTLTRGQYGVPVRSCYPVIWNEHKWTECDIDTWYRVYRNSRSVTVGVFDPDYGHMVYFVEV